MCLPLKHLVSSHQTFVDFGACFRCESKDGAVSEHSPDHWDKLRAYALRNDWDEVKVCALLA